MRVSNRALILLIAGIMILSLAVSGILYLNRPSGPDVIVTVNGREYGRYPLNKDQTIVIHPEDNSWHNTLEIRNGSANVIESDCSNQVCVFTPPLREDLIGIIVCLPHGVAVELSD